MIKAAFRGLYHYMSNTGSICVAACRESAPVKKTETNRNSSTHSKMKKALLTMLTLPLSALCLGQTAAERDFHGTPVAIFMREK